MPGKEHLLHQARESEIVLLLAEDLPRKQYGQLVLEILIHEEFVGELGVLVGAHHALEQVHRDFVGRCDFFIQQPIDSLHVEPIFLAAGRFLLAQLVQFLFRNRENAGTSALGLGRQDLANVVSDARADENADFLVTLHLAQGVVRLFRARLEAFEIVFIENL